MDSSMIIAKAFGVYLIVSGAFLLLQGKTLPLILKDFFRHRAIVYLTSVLLLVFGAVLMLWSQERGGRWSSLVALFGFLAFVKGILYMFAPGLHTLISMKKMRPVMWIFGVLFIFIGFYLFSIS